MSPLSQADSEEAKAVKVEDVKKDLVLSDKTKIRVNIGVGFGVGFALLGCGWGTSKYMDSWKEDIAVNTQAVSAIATAANAKADQLISAQTRMFAALTQTNQAVQAINVSMAEIKATVTTQFSALSKQVDRVESKQDGSR